MKLTAVLHWLKKYAFGYNIEEREKMSTVYQIFKDACSFSCILEQKGI